MIDIDLPIEFTEFCRGISRETGASTTWREIKENLNSWLDDNKIKCDFNFDRDHPKLRFYNETDLSLFKVNWL